MQTGNAAVFRLRVVAEADQGALIRALQLFQARNLIPLRVAAQRTEPDLLKIEIDVAASDCTHETCRLIVAKLNELPIVLEAAVCQ